MADMNKRGPDCDDCDGEKGERGKRGPRGHDGHDGQDGVMGPTGPTGPTGPRGDTGDTGVAGSTGPTGTVELAESSWAMKWSGRVASDPAGVVRNLADAGANTGPGVGTENRYPFASTHTATAFAFRIAENSLTGTSATINLLKGDDVFASAPAGGEAGDWEVVPLSPEVFVAGENISVQIVLDEGEVVSGDFAAEITVEFQGPRGPSGPTGPGGPVAVVAAALVASGGIFQSNTGFATVQLVAGPEYLLTLQSPPLTPIQIVAVATPALVGTMRVVVDPGGFIRVAFVPITNFNTGAFGLTQFRIVATVADPI